MQKFPEMSTLIYHKKTIIMGAKNWAIPSIVCQEDGYLKALVRYIQLNQVRGRLVKDLKELKKNPWSGHSAILGKIKKKVRTPRM
jgi:hypothetical protein